jgi:hypothetical protein
MRDPIAASHFTAANPAASTGLDAILRNLGVCARVVVGVSLNVAIPNLAMDAVNAAYPVIVPRDAVAGVPAEYRDAVIENTLSLLATVTTTDELLDVWKKPMTEIAPEVCGGFPEIRPVEAPAELGRCVAALLTTVDGTLLSEAHGLMIRLLPHQP